MKQTEVAKAVVNTPTHTDAKSNSHTPKDAIAKQIESKAAASLESSVPKTKVTEPAKDKKSIEDATAAVVAAALKQNQSAPNNQIAPTKLDTLMPGSQPFEMMSEVGATADTDNDADNMTEITSDNKLEQQIINQAKAVTIQQSLAAANGTAKISSAAAALNNAEMGLKVEVDASTSAQEASVVPISSDQLYVDEER